MSGKLRARSPRRLTVPYSLANCSRTYRVSFPCDGRR